MQWSVDPRDIHPGWFRLNEILRNAVVTRRRLLPGAALMGAAALWPSLLSGERSASAASLPDQANWPSTNKIKHVVILCQENRSFDHYFGAFAARLGGAGRPANGFDPDQLTYRDGDGRAFHPYHLKHYCDEDPDHTWEGSHAKWNNGAMDGWVQAEDGKNTAIGYYKPADHIYHLKLAKAFSIADHNFCSQIGPTLPNRLYLWSGTSGWNHLTPSGVADALPFNNPPLIGAPPLLNWPTMADVLEDARLPWKCYSVADGSVPSAIGAFDPGQSPETCEGDCRYQRICRRSCRRNASRGFVDPHRGDGFRASSRPTRYGSASRLAGGRASQGLERLGFNRALPHL
jgi:phospholipase C